MGKWTTTRIRDSKGKQRIACLTAADYAMARVIDAAGIPLVLVGDSLAMTVLGYETTLPVTVDEMLHHTSAVVRGIQDALVVADMPFMSYQVSPEQALENAGRFLKEAGADAVKIEGGSVRSETVKALVANGIPVLGHIGLTPQSIRQMGGYKVQGRKNDEAQELLADARVLADAGVFALVLECVPRSLAAEITKSIAVPTIGIGAGPECDGQVLVSADLLGMYSDLSPSFVKRYAELGSIMQDAFAAYRDDVSNGDFPTAEHSF
jgi:3-methyl-2-oxobutanoate hydroxymethyltransferase